MKRSAARRDRASLPRDILAKILSRRGLHLNAYNYQSIIRGGHTFLTIRTGPEKVTNMGIALIC
jgi:2-oxoglutarate ferredoxin oxidoreductase subunit alpha